MLMHEYLITVHGLVDAGGYSLRASTQNIVHLTAAKGAKLAEELQAAAKEAFPDATASAVILSVFDCGEDEYPEPGPEA